MGDRDAHLLQERQQVVGVLFFDGEDRFHQRGAAMFFGLALGVAGFVGAVQASSFRDSLALESAMAWLAVAAAVVVVLAALLMPRYARRSTTIEHA